MTYINNISIFWQRKKKSKYMSLSTNLTYIGINVNLSVKNKYVIQQVKLMHTFKITKRGFVLFFFIQNYHWWVSCRKLVLFSIILILFIFWNCVDSFPCIIVVLFWFWICSVRNSVFKQTLRCHWYMHIIAYIISFTHAYHTNLSWSIKIKIKICLSH